MNQQQTVYTELKDAIVKGVWAAGAKIPSENQLSEKYKTTRVTVRVALSRLLAEGYIIRKNGIGSIVSEKRNTLGLLTFKGFSEVAANEGKTAETIELEAPQLGHWPENFFYPLPDKIAEQPCIIIKRLRKIGGSNVLLEYTYLPADQIAGMLSEPLIGSSLFKTLQQRYLIEVDSVSQDIKAIKADKAIADILDIHVDEPVIQIYRRYTTNEKDYYVYSYLIGNTKDFFLSNQFDQNNII